MKDTQFAQMGFDVEFFKENQLTIESLNDEATQQTLNQVLLFMAALGIERITVKGETPEDDKRYRDNLKKKKVATNG
jgi:hypothetical protein